MKEYTYIDLFAGAGGLSLGFKRAGFKNIFAVEFDENYAKTYKNNFKNHKIYVEDICKITDKDIKKMLDDKKADIIIGGPPCQGFSIAGKIGRSFIEDDRNKLFREFVKFVNVIKPKMFIMENVASLERHNKGQTILEIKREFEKIGYKVKYKVLLASDFGIPQDRRRIFVVGLNNNNSFQFPDKVEMEVSVKDAIDDLPKIKSGEISKVPNHIAMNHTKQMLKKMQYVQDGGNRNDIPEKIRPKSGDPRKYIRYNSTKPSYCITGDMRKVFHYSQNRALTARELARIQTFPDNFIFYGNSGQIQQQIGNAVPPKLAEMIASKAKEALDEK